jgi:hypothetical protein
MAANMLYFIGHYWPFLSEAPAPPGANVDSSSQIAHLPIVLPSYMASGIASRQLYGSMYSVQDFTVHHLSEEI